MTEYDDLDELERELGQWLRTGLGRDAAVITGESQLATHQQFRDTNDATSDEVTVVDTRRPRPARTARRRWVVAAAVAAGVAIIAATLLPEGTGDDHRIRLRPASQTTVPTTPQNVLTPPATSPGDGSREYPLVPNGVASAPPTGELVAAITLYHKGSYRLYADGRLIWADDTRPGPLHGSNEQRLSPEGVERLRSAFLASGLFDPAQPSSDNPPCALGFQACVRGDGDQVLGKDVGPGCFTTSSSSCGPFGNPPPEAVRLFDSLRTLDSTLPPTDWADQQIKTYVPARIAVCLSMYTNQAQVPLDLSILLPRFPAQAAVLLAGRESSAEFVRLWGQIVGQPPAEGSCFELTLDEARMLADALLSPSGGGEHAYWGIVIGFGPQRDPAQPSMTRPEGAYVHFEELLPEGTPSRYYGG